VTRRTARDLTALADGTLPPKRRARLLRRVSASPRLARALKQQLVALDAIRRLDTPAPTELRERIQRATREACATQQSASPTAMTAHAGPRLIQSQRLGAPRW
jgi:anti-sigma factor RsiW